METGPGVLEVPVDGALAPVLPEPHDAVRRRADVLCTPSVVAAVAMAAGSAVRAWQTWDRLPVVWNDSLDYLDASRLPMISLERWAGLRPMATPALLSVLDQNTGAFMHVQSSIAAVCWALLAGAVAACLPSGWRRWAAALIVVVLSCITSITMWDQSVLSESLALSLLALVVAATLALERGVTPWRIAGLLAAVAAWASVRDSHATVVLLAAVVVAVWLAIRRPRTWRPMLVLVAGLAVIGAAVTWSASHGHRDAQPVEHVLAARVLPFPDRVHWFADHGMPQADALGALAPIHAGGRAPFTAVPPDPEYAPWRAWLRAHGRSTLVAWSLTHPSYLWSEPLHSPERVFNNADGHLDFYRPASFRATPLAWPHRSHVTWWLVGASVALFAVAVWRRTWRSPLALTGALLVVTAAPHAAVVWHSDGMESARHLVVPGVQLRIGVVLLLASCLARKPAPA
ncbi:MAG: hypothetical protein JWM05_2005 [Acidimicrobiales bacterium]|nr:hypothetical protein [Acidimicrobiales bacterium]